MSTAYQQAPTNLYTGELPDLNPDGGTAFEFVPPEDGWQELIFKINYVTAPDGRSVPEVRPAIFEGQVKPNAYQIRLVWHLTDPDTDVTPWRQWVGWTINGDKSFLRKVLLAIRNDEPFPADQRLNLEFLQAHENRPVLANIQVDEVPARDNPERILFFPKIVGVKPVAAKPGRRQAKVAGREASKPAATSPAATDKQIAFIDSLGRAAELDADGIARVIYEATGGGIDDLTKSGASRVIDRLRALAEEAEAAEAGDEEEDTFPDIPKE